ncbi:MAG: cytochrome P450 [Parasphingorhabdus sp.]
MTISLFDEKNLIDPYPIYRKLRAETPVQFVPEMNFHVVTRYQLIRQVLRDTKTYSSKFADFLAGLAMAAFESASAATQAKVAAIQAQMLPPIPTMLTEDPPVQTMYRSLVAMLFTASQVNKTEPQVIEVVEKTIDHLGDLTRLDFMREFAFPIPLEIIGKRLGIPGELVEKFNICATSAAGTLRLSPLTEPQLIDRAQKALDLEQMLIGLIDDRRRDPKDDMITILATSKLEKEDRLLEYNEMLSILNQFLVAGHETTTSTFGWGMLLLCRNPELQKDLQADPSQIPVFVEEVLRLETPVQGLPRLVTEDTVLGDYPLKAGDVIFSHYGSANRDDEKFEDPEACLLGRKGAGAHLSFGSGVHACPGSSLARQELNRGFEALLVHAKNFRLDDAYPDPVSEPSIILRALPELHIKFDLK